MSEKVTPFFKKKDKLYACLICKHHWHGPDQTKCPNCKCVSIVEDQLHYVPKTHNVYTCRCNDNALFKIANHPRHGVYFKCIMCGMKHQPADIGLGEKH